MIYRSTFLYTLIFVFQGKKSGFEYAQLKPDPKANRIHREFAESFGATSLCSATPLFLTFHPQWEETGVGLMQSSPLQEPSTRGARARSP